MGGYHAHAMNASDDELLLRAKGGDRQALGDLLLRCGPAIRSGLEINAKWRAILEPDDIMQVTYFEAFERIDRFQGRAKAFRPWLRRIAENNLRDAIQWLQRDKRPQPGQRFTPAGSVDSLAWLCERLTGGGATPSRHAIGNEMRQLLESEIDCLPADYATVLRRIYLEGCTVAEVAETMERTRGAVHLLRIRAVERLRARLGSGSQFFSFHG